MNIAPMKTAGAAIGSIALSAAVILQACAQDTDEAAITIWQEAAKQDLQAIYGILNENHPGPVDPLNPGYRDWLEDGLQDALAQASQVSDFAGYYYTLSGYMDGFNDGHLGIGLRLEPTRLYWPGFVLAYDGRDAYVASASEGSKVTVGDKLLSCDGQDFLNLMNVHVFPYYGIDGLEAETVLNAHRLFTGMRNPFVNYPQTCSFERDGQSLSLSFDLQRIRPDTLDEHLGAATAVDEREYGVFQEDDGIYRIAFGSFAVSEAGDRLQETLDAIASHAVALRRAKLIVFDLRSNGGGSSYWGRAALQAIWGEEIVSYLWRAGFDYIDWRVSDENIEANRFFMNREFDRNGRNTDTARYYIDLVAGMEAARDRGDTFYRIDSTASYSRMPEGYIEPKIVVLTNYTCFSACLGTMDRLLSIPGTIHVGAPTRADAIYIDNTSQLLPTGLAALGYSMKVYRGRVRGHNEPYIPDHRWQGANWDTGNIMEWIKALVEEKDARP